MKLLKALFLLILALELLARRDKTKKLDINEQSRDSQNRAPNNSHPPTNNVEKLTSPIEVSIIHPKPDDEQKWRNEQKKFWERQLAIASFGGLLLWAVWLFSTLL